MTLQSTASIEVSELEAVETKSWVAARNESLSLRAADLARLLGISCRHVAALEASGRLPKAVRLGRCKIWIRKEIEAWLAAGAPGRSRWEAIGAGRATR